MKANRSPEEQIIFLRKVINRLTRKLDEHRYRLNPNCVPDFLGKGVRRCVICRGDTFTIDKSNQANQCSFCNGRGASEAFNE